MKLILLIALLLSAAAPAGAGQLKIGLLLIEDSVPFYVAEQQKFFDQEQVEVDLVPFLSALERDSALAAGAIDGAISDPVGALLFDKGHGLLKITSIGLGQTPGEGVFAILAAPQSNITSLEELKNIEIAVSNATIIEYVTDRLLEQHGFSAQEIKKIEVKKMPIRMQMLLAGSVKAATLPEPLASIAVGKGARLLASDADAEQSLSQTVIVFRTGVMSAKQQEISRFFRAYDRAVQAINSDPERFRAIFVDKGRIPPFMAKNYPIPTYPRPARLAKSLYDPIIEWLSAKGLVNHVPYETIVAREFMEHSN